MWSRMRRKGCCAPLAKFIAIWSATMCGTNSLPYGAGVARRHTSAESCQVALPSPLRSPVTNTFTEAGSTSSVSISRQASLGAYTEQVRASPSPSTFHTRRSVSEKWLLNAPAAAAPREAKK